jgi:hypothetical protein
LKSTQRVDHARREIEWLKKNWFGEPAYLKLDSRPALLSFGHDGLTDTEWTDALKGLANPLLYLSEHTRRSAASGAFDWPVPQVGTKAQDTFYKTASTWPVAMGVAFPRFHDIYEQAKVHKSWGAIDDNGGKTVASTLEAALKLGKQARKRGIPAAELDEAAALLAKRAAGAAGDRLDAIEKMMPPEP